MKCARTLAVFYTLVLLTGCLTGGRSVPAPPETRQASEKFNHPIKITKVLSNFGRRGGRYHTGIDLLGRRGGGDPVLASRAGRVIYVGRLSGYGNLVSIQHYDGFVTRYAHLKSASVKKGDHVNAFQKIGIVGRTGRATTAHLHFEILTPKTRFLDPYPYLFP